MSSDLADTVTITPVTGTDLYYRPAGEENARARVSLHLRDGDLRASAVYDNLLSADWHRGYTSHYGIPALTERAANALLAEILPLAQRVLDGAEETYDGSNWVVRLNADAQAADEAIARLCDGLTDVAEDVISACPIGDRSDYDVTADTTDEEIAAMVAADLEGMGMPVVDDGLTEQLEAWRDEARQERRDALEVELDEVAVRLAAARAEQADALKAAADVARRAVAAGITESQAIRSLGVAHTTVRAWIGKNRPRKS